MPCFATFTGSRPSDHTGTPISRPRVRSCSTAAGRSRSAAISRGRLPLPLSCFASLAHAVVLPEPWTPAIMMTAGRAPPSSKGWYSPPIVTVSSSSTTFTICWPGREALHDLFGLSARSRTRPRKSSATSTDDVGLEQRGAHVAQGVVHLLGVQLALGAELLEGAVEAFGQRIEHRAVFPALSGGCRRSVRRPSGAGRVVGFYPGGAQRMSDPDLRDLDLVAVTSHEMRAPLAAIRGFVDILQRRGEELSDAGGRRVPGGDLHPDRTVDPA